jgi:hypothetical protein
MHHVQEQARYIAHPRVLTGEADKMVGALGDSAVTGGV